MSLKTTKCRHCGENAYRLALIALLQDAGCSTSPSADVCPAREDDLPHDFIDPEDN